MSEEPEEKAAEEDGAGEWTDETSDPYCGELARMTRSVRAGPRPAATPDRGTWQGEERREDGIACYDPYLVSVMRTSRGND